MTAERNRLEREEHRERLRLKRQEQLITFLGALAATGVVGTACKAAGVTRPRALRWREEYPRRWQDAMDQATDGYIEEARRRAVDGLVRKKFGGRGQPLIDPETGQQYQEREYSDQMLLALLRARVAEFADPRTINLDARQQTVFAGDAIIAALLRGKAEGDHADDGSV